MLLIIIGLLFKHKKSTTLEKSLTLNFIGNEILCQTATLIIYFTYGYKQEVVFLAGALLAVLALILHIHDITGKPINSIIDKLKFSEKNLRDNFYMRVTLILVIIFAIFFLATVIINKIGS